MAEGDLVMSVSERDRGHVVRQVIEHRLSQREASERLGIGVPRSSGWFGRGGGMATPGWCHASVVVRRIIVCPRCFGPR